MKHLLAGIMAVAATASFGALAQQDKGAPVIRGETVMVWAPHIGGYITQEDAALIGDAKRALDQDAFTKSAIVTLVANNGDLTVIGTTTDIAQSSRVIMKLKRLPGAKRVYAFIEPMTGDSQ